MLEELIPSRRRAEQMMVVRNHENMQTTPATPAA
jgi:hypothetical protein